MGRVSLNPYNSYYQLKNGSIKQIKLNVFQSFAGNREQDKTKENGKDIQLDEQNPISYGKEAFIAVIGLLIVLLCFLGQCYADIFLDNNIVGDLSAKEPFKNRMLSSLGLFGVVFLALLPLTIYNSRQKTFKKEKDMDVYIKANSAEKTIFEKIDQRASNESLTQKEQQDLKSNFAKMSAAKQQVPKSITDLNGYNF